MKVSDILRVKGGTLFTVAPDQPLASRRSTSWPSATSARWSSWKRGELVGMLTFREVIQAVVNNGGASATTGCAA